MGGRARPWSAPGGKCRDLARLPRLRMGYLTAGRSPSRSARSLGCVTTSNRLIPPPAETARGLGFYLSDTPGVGGHLKTTPEDFRVDELSAYPTPDAQGRFTVLRIESQGWEQHELADAIARRLGLPRRAVTWAGTKDRRAVTERLFSYVGPLPSVELELPRVRVVDIYSAREPVRLGDHFGNRFEVRLRGLDGAGPHVDAALRATLASLRSQGGIPNFYGPQRFGEVRPITHEVGRAIVRGQIGRAVDIYLAAVPPGDDPGVHPARRAYGLDHDASRALREFPREYRFERTLLEHLARGHSPERALRGLTRELRLLFVHAYQSLLFNRWLSERHKRGLPLNGVVRGDSLLRRGRDGTLRGDDAVPVDDDNLRECTTLVSHGDAVLAGPLVGYETEVPAGPAGEVLATVLADEQLAPDAFRLPATPELASAGSWRPALVALPPIDLRVEETSPDGKVSAWFRFSLPRGAYATVLLREFSKRGGRAPG